MISGFTQLRCGISTYHWRRVVNTAWFACVTHLCCLTFLRDHLIHNRIAQLWRVPAMVALTTMIIYALTTTSQYDWDTSEYNWDISKYNWDMSEYNWNTTKYNWTSNIPGRSVSPADQAICYLDPSFSDGYLLANWRFRILISMIFLGFGMINRFRRLYHAPNLILSKGRAWVSCRVRGILMYYYGKSRANSFIACIVAVLVYRPLLALFLTVRLLMDGLTSMAFEVRKHGRSEALTIC
jgi:hypothetical protein